MSSLLIFARMTLSVAIVITGVPSGLQSEEYVQADETHENQPDDNPERDFPVLHSSPAIQRPSSFGGAGIPLKDTLPAQDSGDGGTARHACGLDHQHLPAASEHTLC